MKEVEHYFSIRDLINLDDKAQKTDKTPTKRVVYLATDEISVLNEAKAK